jgi:hypothetical protein
VALSGLAEPGSHLRGEGRSLVGHVLRKAAWTGTLVAPGSMPSYDITLKRLAPDEETIWWVMSC